MSDANIKNMKYTEESYNKIISELFSRHPSIQNVGFAPGAYKPGLDGMLAFSRSLGDHWKQYKCIHVAGTNGKGSVSSMIAAGLASSGMRVGLYTSPHLTDFRERMKIISDGSWEMPRKEEILEFVENSSLDGLSFFEVTTGMAFKWFADRHVDIAVIETGLGGRLDSTNIITPIASVITSIGLDHCEMLGSTRAAIAREKAGIFKPGVPAIVSTRDPETKPVFEEVAAEKGCPLYFAEDYAEELFDTDLKGPHQDENLRTALCALDVIGVRASRESISHTAALTGLRGRWEKLLDSPETICDIGHNPAALEFNFRRLEQSGRPLFIVYGIMADKDISAIRPLMPQNARYYLAAPAIARALPVDRLADFMAGLDIARHNSVKEAVEHAISDASGVKDALVYIGGSNYLVSECILEFERHKN